MTMRIIMSRLLLLALMSLCCLSTVSPISAIQIQSHASHRVGGILDKLEKLLGIGSNERGMIQAARFEEPGKPEYCGVEASARVVREMQPPSSNDSPNAKVPCWNAARQAKCLQNNLGLVEETLQRDLCPSSCPIFKLLEESKRAPDYDCHSCTTHHAFTCVWSEWDPNSHGKRHDWP